MDTLRGNFGTDDFGQANFEGSLDDDQRDWDFADEDSVSESPPVAIGTDERRMQVRAYNHWASLLGDQSFPSIEDLEPENLPDFGPYSVLLDFTLGVGNPGIQYLGDQLAVECGTHEEIDVLADIPTRSLLSRITDHFMQILANQAPIGFEAEFVNQRGATILYRGILLPFSSDGEAIDFIFGVINWKEMADQMTTDELMLEIDQALEASSDEDEIAEEEAPREPDPVTEWADGPAADVAALPTALGSEFNYDDDIDEDSDDWAESLLDDQLPSPLFGAKKAAGLSARRTPIDLSGHEYLPSEDILETGQKYHAPEIALEYGTDDISEESPAYRPEYHMEESPVDSPVIHQPDKDEGLSDCLAAARALAHVAHSSEDRSRSALYAAVGRAYDFSLMALEERDEFDELVTSNGLTVQERAPMTPVVKLVFGADYDKTRLTEYAAVLSHAHRMEVGRGMLANFLSQADGGLKGVLKAERQIRRAENGKVGEEAEGPQEKLARKLRGLELKPFDSLATEGGEFGLVVIRRMPDGEIVMLGEITGDVPLVERAARKLVS